MLIELFNKLNILPVRFIQSSKALFMARPLSNKKYDLFSATVILCQEGGFIAFFEHRSDIIANGDTEKQVLKNLKTMYLSVLKDEKDGYTEKPVEDIPLELPADWKTKQSIVKIPRI